MNRQWRGEDGASLIIALVFVLLISLILLAIVTLTGTNIVNTTRSAETK